MNDDDAAQTLRRVLRDARSLLADPERWIASGYAADPAGRWCPVGSTRATRFSLLGAFIRAGGRGKDLVEAARVHLGPTLYMKISVAEPDLSHAEALSILDELLVRLEGSAQPAPRRSGFVTRPALEGARTTESSRKKGS